MFVSLLAMVEGPYADAPHNNYVIMYYILCIYILYIYYILYYVCIMYAAVPRGR